MSLTTAEKRAINEWYLAQPHHGIPTDDFNTIKSVGDGVTLPIWGRGLLPHQIRWLYDKGITQPAAIHDAITKLPHPNAPNVTVGEYPDYVAAQKEYEEHSK
jgi:hypothetical protein